MKSGNRAEKGGKRSASLLRDFVLYDLISGFLPQILSISRVTSHIVRTGLFWTRVRVRTYKTFYLILAENIWVNEEGSSENYSCNLFLQLSPSI